MLDPNHIDLVRHVFVAIGAIFVIWFIVMLILFASPARAARSRRR